MNIKKLPWPTECNKADISYQGVAYVAYIALQPLMSFDMPQSDRNTL
jgi:hypothetical protein